MKEIGYLSDTIGEYNAAVSAADTLEKLLAAMDEFRSVADDARKAAPQTPRDFETFRKGWLSEKSGEFAGLEWAERFGAVLLPEVLMRVAMVASKFGAPFGAAYIRCTEHGLIVHDAMGIARWTENAEMRAA